MEREERRLRQDRRSELGSLNFLRSLPKGPERRSGMDRRSEKDRRDLE